MKIIGDINNGDYDVECTINELALSLTGIIIYQKEITKDTGEKEIKEFIFYPNFILT